MKDKRVNNPPGRILDLELAHPVTRILLSWTGQPKRLSTHFHPTLSAGELGTSLVRKGRCKLISLVLKMNKIVTKIVVGIFEAQFLFSFKIHHSSGAFQAKFEQKISTLVP